MNEEPIEIQDFPNGAMATVLVYDLIGNTNPEANAAIKEKLMGEDYGWEGTIPSILVRQCNVRDHYLNGEAMPSTTLWKIGTNLAQAVTEFEQVLYVYNMVNNLNPRIQGKAVAFYVSHYSALLRL